MKKQVQVLNNVPIFWRIGFAVVFLFTAGLFIAGLFMPPQGVIDKSVLIAGGILMTPICFFVLFLTKALDGLEIDVKKGTIKMNKKKNNETETEKN